MDYGTVSKFDSKNFSTVCLVGSQEFLGLISCRLSCHYYRIQSFSTWVNWESNKIRQEKRREKKQNEKTETCPSTVLRLGSWKALQPWYSISKRLKKMTKKRLSVYTGKTLIFFCRVIEWPIRFNTAICYSSECVFMGLRYALWNESN